MGEQSEPPSTESDPFGSYTSLVGFSPQTPMTFHDTTCRLASPYQPFLSPSLTGAGPQTSTASLSVTHAYDCTHRIALSLQHYLAQASLFVRT